MRAPIVAPVVATPMRRGLAFLLDVLILTIIGIPVIAAFGDTAQLEPGHVDTTVLAVGMFVTASYHIFFLATMSATLGKVALGIYVANGQGGRIRPDTAILRYLVYMLGQLTFIGMVISAVMLLTDPRRRTLHDRAAGTLVLVGKPPGLDAGGGDPLNRYRR